MLAVKISCCCLEGFLGESLFLAQHGLGLQSYILTNHFWNNVLGICETKVEMFGHKTQQHIW